MSGQAQCPFCSCCMSDDGDLVAEAGRYYCVTCHLAWERGREDFRREVAEALRTEANEHRKLREFANPFTKDHPLVKAEHGAASLLGWVCDRYAGLLASGTFPKPPPSSGGEGGGT